MSRTVATSFNVVTADWDEASSFDPLTYYDEGYFSGRQSDGYRAPNPCYGASSPVRSWSTAPPGHCATNGGAKDIGQAPIHTAMPQRQSDVGPDTSGCG
jgi:hypothetical protein